MDQVLTNFDSAKDDELSGIAAAIIAGCTDNADFSVVAQLAAVVTDTTVYNGALAACAHGDEAKTTTKNKKKGLLLISLRKLGVQINIQANGDRVKALGSGFPMEKTPGPQTMGETQNFNVTTTNIAGAMAVSVNTPVGFTTHGTIFAYWNPALGPTPLDINSWFQRHSNGASLIVPSFTPGVTYPFAAAFKGRDGEALIWSAVINKMAGD